MSSAGQVARIITDRVKDSSLVTSVINTFAIDDRITIEMHDGKTYTLTIDGPHEESQWISGKRPVA
jgi:hypothetical protein